MAAKTGLRLVISPGEIRAIVKRLAREIERDYADRTPVLVGVLKGSFVFLSDLARELSIPVEVDFIRTLCYGTRDVPSDEVCIMKDIEMDIEGRDVLIVEDIVDRGVTVNAVMEHLGKKNPATLRFCALLLKEGAGAFNIDYLGRTITGGFVVGYGMDYKERYRNLPGIYLIDTERGG